MSPDVELLKAIVASTATVAVAVIGLIGVIASSRRPSKDKPPTGDTGRALAKFEGTQNEFMSLVIADNGALRTQMERTNSKLESMDAQLNQFQDELAEVRHRSDTFLGAVRRYLMKLATAWTGAEPMPWPDEEDFHILEDTLPQTREESTTRREQR